MWDKISKDNEIAYQLKEVELSNLLQGLSDGTLDIAITPLSITEGRLQKFDFSTPYYVATSTLAVKQQSDLSSALSILKSFFSFNFFKALLALIGVITIFGLLIWLFERKANSEEFGHGFTGIMNGFWWSAVTMTTVGYGDKSPRTPGGRLIALIWMFTAIIIISGFTASIASSLTINTSKQEITEISDLQDARIGTVAQSRTEEWLESNFIHSQTTTQNVYQVLDQLIADTIDVVAYDKPALDYIEHAKNNYDIELLPIEFNAQFYAIGYSNALPDTLKHRLNLSLLHHTEGQEWKVVLSKFGLSYN